MTYCDIMSCVRPQPSFRLACGPQVDEIGSSSSTQDVGLQDLLKIPAVAFSTLLVGIGECLPGNGKAIAGGEGGALCWDGFGVGLLKELKGWRFG